MQPNQRRAAVVLLFALFASACGSRLDRDQVAVFAGQGTGSVGGSVTQDDGTGTQVPVEESVVGEVTTQHGGTDAAGGASEAAAGSVGGTGQDGGDGGSAGGESSGADGGQGTTRDTRAAPPGGNGGATDVGVTGDTITIYNVADLTGAVPGLFRDAKEATQAYIAHFTATEGTVYGRRIQFVSRDTGLSSNGNRSAYLDACEQAFAAVGSMSAFEEGAAEPLSCGLPDLRNIPTSKALQQRSNSLGTDALRVGRVPLSEWTYYKETFPGAISKAAYVFLENTTTSYQTGQNRAATEKIGYVWKEVVPVAVSETNYARIATTLKNSQIELVAFQGAYQQAVRLVEAMQQQDYAPKALALQSNTYVPELLETCQGACDEYVSLAQTGALVEEIEGNPELQTYAEWLKRINPNAQPTGLGMYSWGAAKLFVQALKAIGPEPTRASLLEYLRGVSGYDGGGLFPPQDIGSQVPTDCIIMLDIEDNRFVRAEPGDDYRCRTEPGRT